MIIGIFLRYYKTYPIKGSETLKRIINIPAPLIREAQTAIIEKWDSISAHQAAASAITA
jgi:hypothetical protein